MVGVENQGGVEELRELRVGVLSLQHVEKIGGDIGIRLRRQGFLAVADAVEPRYQSGHARHHAGGLADVGVVRIVVPVGVVEGHDGGDGAHVLHGVNVGRQAVHDVEHGFREGVLAADIVDQLVEFGLAWQLSVPQQVHHLFKGRVLCQIFNHVAAIGQGRSND